MKHVNVLLCTLVVMLLSYLALVIVVLAVWLAVEYCRDLAIGALTPVETWGLPLALIALLLMSAFPVLMIASFISTETVKE